VKLTDLDADVLQHLAYTARSRQSRMPLRLVDPEATATALAELLVDGVTPALGWWRAQLAPRLPSDAPLCPPASPLEPPTETDVILLAEELATLRAPSDVALGTLAEMVVLGELSAEVLRRCFDLYEELL
jgi:hypothetical protein